MRAGDEVNNGDAGTKADVEDALHRDYLGHNEYRVPRRASKLSHHVGRQ